MKIALVTGCAKRIGKAIAEGLLDQGFLLILHANTSVGLLRNWVDGHDKRQQVIDIIAADLSTVLGQEELIAHLKNKVDRLDLLVHNASAFSPMAFEEIGREDFRSMLAVNLDAPFFITQGLLPLLKNAPSPSVINIIDALWERPNPKYSHYAVSKAGLAILTRCLASELAPHIRVNGVSPGAILFQPFHTKKIRENTLNRIPAKKLGQPSDIAQAVIYLSQAQYATGEILVIDGGRSIVP